MPRMLTEIYRPVGMIKKKLRVIGNNEILVKKGSKTRGAADYKASFDKDCIVPYRSGIFHLVKQKLMLIEGAGKCIRITYDALEFREELKKQVADLDPIKDKEKIENIKSLFAKIEIPVWTKDDLDTAAEATVIKNSGHITNELKVPALLYVVSFMSVAVGIIILMVQTGRLKI